MAVRVRDFSRGDPSADANYAPVLTRLKTAFPVETLAKQQQRGYLSMRSSKRAGAGSGGGCIKSRAGTW